MRVRKGIGLFLCLISSFSALHTKTTGSNRTSSRQKKIFFPSADDTNELVGFSSFENGLILGNDLTEVLFDSFFPIQGALVLNGGKIKLKNNITINTPVKLGTGIFEAENGLKEINFPFKDMVFSIPAEGHEKVLSPLDLISVSLNRAVDAGGNVHSVDWSFDDQYVAIAVQGTMGGNELQVYSFQNNMLSFEDSINFGLSDAMAVRWHPTKYLLASGKTSNNELEIYDFDPVGGLTVQSSQNVAGTVSAVSWDPSGAHLAVGMQGLSAAVSVFDVDDDGNLGSSVSHSFGLLRSVQRNSIDFDTLGRFIVVGLEGNLLASELFVLEFTGVSLDDRVSVEVGQPVLSVGWMQDEQVFSVGFGGGAERLRSYRFSDALSSVTEILTMRVGLGLDVNDLQWDPAGTYLALGTDSNASGHDVQVYFFDRANHILSLVSGAEVSSDVLAMRWSRDGSYISFGTISNDLDVFDFSNGDMTFANVRLSFNSDILFRSPVHFEGSCTINVGGNNLELASTASFIVEENAILRIENARIKGIHDQNISNVSDDGTIILKDVSWLQNDDYSFAQGSLILSGKVNMSGNQIFAYQSSRTSTLQMNSTLKLDQGFTFSYDPVFTSTLDPGLIELEDESSVVKIDNACVYDLRALKLTKGTLVISRNVDWFGEASSGTVFGSDGGDDLFVQLLPGAKFQLMQGILNSKNQGLGAWMFQAHTSQFIVRSNARFNIFNSIDIEPGFLAFERNARFGRTANAQVLGATDPRGSYFQFVIGL